MDVLWTLAVVVVGGALLAVIVNGVVRGEGRARRGFGRRPPGGRRGRNGRGGDADRG
ncbi:hypothetical protein [Streptomyces bohaiensis]|uniref:hypothetical protein n=1 Tax=Streptomyces bohaiensis TaxID=1431344 RepID=UPI0030C6F3FC